MNLYIAHVGFYDEEIGIYEIHSNLFVVAADIKMARDLIKSKEIYIKKQMHIDGIEELLNIDGYQINASKGSSLSKNKTYSHEDLKALG
jgi:hypothetical protein